MKALNEITDSRDLRQQRKLLLKQLHRQENCIDSDLQRINRSWHIVKQVGSAFSNVAMAFVPKINVATVGLGILKRLLRRKK